MMENLRLIKERIKSCISCNEEQCPFIKERLEQHVLSHHSATSRPSISNHRVRSRPSLQLGKVSPVRSRISFAASDQETSTTDLNNSNRSLNIDYKEKLRSKVLEWSKDLPVYRNSDFENLKQNILNEMIEKFIYILSDVNKEMCDVKIKDKINNVVDSLPTYSEEQGREVPKNNLKENLFNRIVNIKHEYLDTVPKRLSFSKEIGDFKQNDKTTAKDMSTSTSLVLNDDGKQSSTVEPLNNVNDNTFGKTKKFADAEAQHSLAATPHYNNIFKQKTNTKLNSDDDLFKQQIHEWFNQILDRYDENESRVNKNHFVNNLFDDLKPSLKRNVNSTNYKLTLKAKIFDFVDDLPFDGLNNDRVYMNNLAEDLANRLLCVKINTDNFKQTYYSDACLHECAMEVMGLNYDKDLSIKSSIYEVIFDHLYEVKFYHIDIINQITNLFFEKISMETDLGPGTKVEVFKLLKNSSDLDDTVIITTINSIVKQLIRISTSINDNGGRNLNRSGIEIPVPPDRYSIYQSELTFREPQNHSATSNASRRSSILKKDNNCLSSAEKLYIENICNIIKSWINNIPKSYRKTDSKQLKDTIINNLANDILDQVKVEQIAPETGSEKRKYLTFFTLRWLNKVEYFKDINDVKPYVANLIEKIESIAVPQFVQLESRNSSMVQESTIHQTSDDLENQIDHWLQEQPSKLFCIMDQNKRVKIIQKFSQNIRDRLSKNRPSNEIIKEIVKWLSKLIKPEEKSIINELAEELLNKIINSSKGHTHLSTPLNTVKEKPICCDANVGSSPDIDEILKQIIKNYLKYYYDEDNPIARDAFGCIFKTELLNLRTPTRKQAYDKFIKNIQHEDFLQDRLKKELQYTSIVSDWFMTIPVNDFFNTVGNKSRTEKVDMVVKIICDSDEQGTNYADIIHEKIISKLPIQPNHEIDLKRAIEDLSRKIAAARPPKPCCSSAYQTPSINSSGIREQNLSDFIEEYVRANGHELTADELKFNALTSHIEKEIEKSFNEDPPFKEYNKGTSMTCHESLEKFHYKLGCVKEISNWLNNLPLQPISDKAVFDKIVKAVNKLAEEMAEKFMNINIDSLHNNTELEKNITTWILELPLISHRNIDMPTATQQLINRVGRVNRGKDASNITSQSKQKETSGYICQAPHACCNKSILSKSNSHDPAAVIVDTIEKWSNDLPIQADNEINTRELKNNIARKIYQTLGEINRKPDYFNNDILYQRVLSDEIERQLQNLPQNETLKNKKEDLKNQLIQVILENKNMIKEKDSAETYKMQLEKTVEISMPYSIQAQHKTENYKFEIYKERLAEKFILDNFDHSEDEIKTSYEKKINDDIDRFFQQDQGQNVTPLTRDEVNNVLYSALFEVPPPKNNSMSKQVQEIKTKFEIEKWFDTLPLQAAKSDKDLLEWNKILAMLAKRLHQMEKNESANEKIHKEITKWLLRLPLLPGQEQNIDYFADDLQSRLKSTEKYRECQEESTNDTNINNNRKGIPLSTSQTAGSSTEGKNWKSPPMLPACCQATPLQPKKPAELILQIVERWCKQLPLPANTQREVENVNLLKGNLIIKIIIKISELNLNPETFNDEQLYNTLLEDEVENLFSSLPTSFELTQNKNALKSQLIVAIKSVKSLIKEDNMRYEYKQELKTTIERILEEPKDQSIEQVAIFHTLRDEIVDNFIEYNFNKDDIEKQQLHKKVIRDDVANCCANNKEGKNNFLQENPLIKGNQLISELSKIPSPEKTVILEEVQEIRLKTEITKLFNLIPCDINETDFKNQIKTTLAKRLNDYEKVGYTNENKIKIKTEIIKCLEKLEANIDDEVIDKFIEDLERTETVRRVSVSKSNNDLGGSKCLPVVSQKFYEIPQYSFNESTRETSQHPTLCQSKECGSQWMSLLSATPLPQNPNYANASEVKQSFQNNDNTLGGEKGNCRNVDESDISYQSFQRDIQLSSSLTRKDPVIATISKYPTDITHGISNQAYVRDEMGNNNTECNQTCSHQKQMLGSSNSNCSHSPEKSQYPIPNSVFTDKSQQASQTKMTSRYQQPKCQPRKLDCSSDQSIGSVSNCPNVRPRQQQPSQSYAHPTSEEYTQNQSFIPEDARIQHQGCSIPIPLNFPQRRASVLSNSGRPCRRPSITILSPDDMSPNLNKSRRLQQAEPDRSAVLGEEEDLCVCERKKQKVCKGNSSLPTQQKYCRICNGFKPYCCGPSPYRYPGFYYY